MLIKKNTKIFGKKVKKARNQEKILYLNIKNST